MSQDFKYYQMRCCELGMDQPVPTQHFEEDLEFVAAKQTMTPIAFQCFFLKYLVERNITVEDLVTHATLEQLEAMLPILQSRFKDAEGIACRTMRDYSDPESMALYARSNYDSNAYHRRYQSVNDAIERLKDPSITGQILRAADSMSRWKLSRIYSTEDLVRAVSVAIEDKHAAPDDPKVTLRYEKISYALELLRKL